MLLRRSDEIIKLKKISVFILSFVYLIATTGITLHQHFCMNQLVSISLQDSTNDPCSTCGMDQTEKKGCCNDNTIKVKIEQVQLVDASAIALIHPEMIAALHFLNFLQPIIYQKLSFITSGRNPPWQRTFPIFKWNESFLI